MDGALGACSRPLGVADTVASRPVEVIVAPGMPPSSRDPPKSFLSLSNAIADQCSRVVGLRQATVS
jgi:D-serine deaminase-like pyridoxal phosphate-dependent protein